MRMYSSASIAFDAAHRLEFEPCQLAHGHRWEVEVVTENVRNNPELAVSLSKALTDIRGELEYRDLGVMLPAVIASPEGVAAYFRERLIGFFPNLTEVRVRNGVSSAVVVQEKR